MSRYLSYSTLATYKNVIVFFFILLLLTRFYPLALATIFWESKKNLVAIISLFVLLIVFFSRKKITLPNRNFNFSMLVVASCLLLHSVIFSTSSSITVLIWGLLPSWFIVTLLINIIPLSTFLSYYIRFQLFSLVLIVIGLILLSLNILRMYSYVQLEGETILCNYLLFFSKKIDFINEQFVRPTGFYDEPGSLAYITMLLLLLNKKYFDNKKVELALLFLPIFSTSFAHIVTSVVYILFFYLKIKNLKWLFAFLIFGGGVFAYFTSYETDNATWMAVDTYTIGRIEKVMEGKDTSRAGGFEQGPQAFSKHLLGTSPENLEKEFPHMEVEVIWYPLAVYGIFGFIFYYFPFFFIAFRDMLHFRTNLVELKFLIILLLNFIQRPFYLTPIYIVLIYILFYDKTLISRNEMDLIRR